MAANLIIFLMRPICERICHDRAWRRKYVTTRT